FCRFSGAAALRRRRAALALSAEDLAEKAGVRPDRAKARRHVPEELRAVRGARRRRRARRRPRGAPRRGVIAATFEGNGGRSAAVLLHGFACKAATRGATSSNAQ